MSHFTTGCEMRHFYTLRCPAPFWLIQCKPDRNRFITAKVIDKSLGARFFMAHCVDRQSCVNQGGLLSIDRAALTADIASLSVDSAALSVVSADPFATSSSDHAARSGDG